MKNLKPFKKGQSGNPKGRAKGSKNLSTIVRELENEKFNWDKISCVNKGLQPLIDEYKHCGSPLRAIVYKALYDSICGKSRERVAAMEWIRKAGYGNKVDRRVTERKRVEPITVPNIKLRTSR